MAKLTANQEQAILLLAKGETVTATAAAVGVTRQTVSEWLNRDADFRAELNRVRKETLDAGADKLRGMLQKALDALQAGFDSEDLSTRERAQLGMALLKNVGLVQRASAVGSTNADDIRSSQVLSDMLNFAR
jgi:murein DD-endopeptidase MepM/ murein hydrolase activator NlpD